jgi:hypothetical protein
LTEVAGETTFMVKSDIFEMQVVSVGEQPVDDYKVTVRVTQPGGKRHTHKVPMGKGNPLSSEGQGTIYFPFVANFHRTFSIGSNVDPGACWVEAYFPAVLGGDRWSGPLKVVGRGENRSRSSPAEGGDHGGGAEVPPETAGPVNEPPNHLSSTIAASDPSGCGDPPHPAPLRATALAALWPG